MIPDFVEQKSVFLINSAYGYTMSRNFCAASRATGMFPHANVLVRTEKGSPDRQGGYFLSSSMHPVLVGLFNKLTSLEVEHGLLTYLTIRYFAFHTYPDVGDESVHECLANRIVFPDHDLRAPDTAHYVHLFQISGFLFAVCCIILLIELFCRWQPSI